MENALLFAELIGYLIAITAFGALIEFIKEATKFIKIERKNKEKGKGE